MEWLIAAAEIVLMVSFGIACTLFGAAVATAEDHIGMPAAISALVTGLAFVTLILATAAT